MRGQAMTDAIDEQTAKKLKKLEKNSDTRMLDPWERYRALVDTYEAFFDMNELADRKTRFALVMMGALNALNVIFGTQRMFGDLTAGIRPARWRLFHALRGAVLVFLHSRNRHAASAHFDVSWRSAEGRLACRAAIHW